MKYPSVFVYCHLPETFKFNNSFIYDATENILSFVVGGNISRNERNRLDTTKNKNSIQKWNFPSSKYFVIQLLMLLILKIIGHKCMDVVIVNILQSGSLFTLSPLGYSILELVLEDFILSWSYSQQEMIMDISHIVNALTINI